MSSSSSLRMRLALFATLCCSAMMAVVYGADAEAETATGAAAPTERKLKSTPESYPYGKPKTSGIQFSDYQSLAVPTWLLILLLLAFLAFVGLIMQRLFATVKENEAKQAQKKERASSRKSSSRKAD